MADFLLPKTPANDPRSAAKVVAYFIVSKVESLEVC
jgi:hypothetical protein